MQQLLLVDPERPARVEVRLPPRDPLTLDVRAADDVQRTPGIRSGQQAAALFRIALAGVLENLEQELAGQLGRLRPGIARRGGALAPVAQLRSRSSPGRARRAGRRARPPRDTGRRRCAARARAPGPRT